MQPVVSAGNVAQLAADLLISSLALTHIGTFDPSDLVPAVGARDDGPGVATPLECMRHFPISHGLDNHTNGLLQCMERTA